MAASYPMRIGNISAGLMLTTALIFDGLQFLLTLTVIGSIASPLVTFTAVCIFALWFLIHGVNYLGGRKAGIKLLSTLGATIAELVPIINGLPAITLGVIGVVYASRVEDKETAEAKRKAAMRAQKQEQARQVRLAQARMRVQRSQQDNTQEEDQREAA